ncbi:MAG: KH domain-containing protein [Myxococcales bacterium]|nr:KH domain-containing protein [Myxococcales bacterium]
MDELLHYVASILVDHPDEVVVESSTDDEGTIVLRLTVSEDDIGKVIGKQGRTARAMRNLMHAAAEQRQQRVNVQFVDA